MNDTKPTECSACLADLREGDHVATCPLRKPAKRTRSRFGLSDATAVRALLLGLGPAFTWDVEPFDYCNRLAITLAHRDVLCPEWRAQVTWPPGDVIDRDECDDIEGAFVSRNDFLHWLALWASRKLWGKYCDTRRKPQPLTFEEVLRKHSGATPA